MRKSKVQRFNIRAVPLRSFVLVEGEWLAEAVAIFAREFGYDEQTTVQWKRAGASDKRVPLNRRTMRP